MNGYEHLTQNLVHAKHAIHFSQLASLVKDLVEGEAGKAELVHGRPSVVLRSLDFMYRTARPMWGNRAKG